MQSNMDSWRLGKIAVMNKPKAIFEEKMTKKFPKMMENIQLHI